MTCIDRDPKAVADPSTSCYPEPAFWRRSIPGPDGELLLAYEQQAALPLLVDQVVSARRVRAELAWRVARLSIAVRIAVRGRVAACLRPLICGESRQLQREEILRCEERRFTRRRDQVLEAMFQGERRRAFLCCGPVLLAQLEPLPGSGAELRQAPLPFDPPPNLAQRIRQELPLRLTGGPSREPNRSLSSEQASRVDHHLSLVKALARQAANRYSRQVLSFEEFVSAGYEALVHAALRYNPRGPASFATYARPRVEGAMIDALRKRRPRPRRGKRRSARPPTREYLLPGCDGFEDAAPSPEHALLIAEQRHRLHEVLGTLSPQDQALIEALYMNDRFMKDVARETGVSGATISRQHARLLRRLRSRLLVQAARDRLLPPHAPCPTPTL